MKRYLSTNHGSSFPTMQAEWSPTAVAAAKRFNEAFLHAATIAALESMDPPFKAQVRQLEGWARDPEFNKAMKAIATTAIEAGCIEVLKLAANSGLEVAGS